MTKESKEYNICPANFKSGSINIPIAYPINRNDLFTTEVSVISVLESAEKGTAFCFYLIHGDDISAADKAKFEKLAELYNICCFEFIKSDLKQEYYPLEISEKLPEINKLIYFNDKISAMHDLRKFFCECNADDCFLIGLPENFITHNSTDRRISGEIFVINCDRFRKQEILRNAEPFMDTKNAAEILNILCADHIEYFAEQFITFAGSAEEYSLPISSKRKNRVRFQQEAAQRPILYFEDNEPWFNIQGIYSNFWWSYAAKTPMLFKFPEIDPETAAKQFNDQQNELDLICEIINGNCRDDLSSYLNVPGVNRLSVTMNGSEKAKAEKQILTREKAVRTALSITESRNVLKKKKQHSPVEIDSVEYGNLSTLGKAKVYFKTYGFMPTIKKILQKLKKQR